MCCPRGFPAFARAIAYPWGAYFRHITGLPTHTLMGSFWSICWLSLDVGRSPGNMDTYEPGELALSFGVKSRQFSSNRN
jgi:hypothetical protein